MPDISINKLMAKLKSIKGLEELLEQAVLLYILLTDADVPKWVKAIVIAALLYLIDPVDAVPDVIPVAGLLDDLAVIAAAIKAVTDHIRQHHRYQAEAFIKDL